MKTRHASLILLGVIATLLASCATIRRHETTDIGWLLDQAVTLKHNSHEQAIALCQLFNLGTIAKRVSDTGWMYDGDRAFEGGPYSTYSRVDRNHYVFYGTRWANTELVLIEAVIAPDGTKHLVEKARYTQTDPDEEHFEIAYCPDHKMLLISQ